MILSRDTCLCEFSSSSITRIISRGGVKVLNTHIPLVAFITVLVLQRTIAWGGLKALNSSVALVAFITVLSCATCCVDMGFTIMEKFSAWVFNA